MMPQNFDMKEPSKIILLEPMLFCPPIQVKNTFTKIVHLAKGRLHVQQVEGYVLSSFV